MSKKQYYCDYGYISSRNGVVYLHCKKIDDFCGFQRWCTNDQCVKHTNSFVDCKYRKGIDDVSKKKKNRNQQEKPVINNNKPVMEREMSEDMRKRCKVILVTPDYFIIENNGFARKIREKTDLKAGDFYILEEEDKKKQEVKEVKKEELKKEEKVEIIEEKEVEIEEVKNEEEEIVIDMEIKE